MVGETDVYGVPWRTLSIVALPRDNTLLQESLLFWAYPRISTLSVRASLKSVFSQTKPNRRL